ncbi:MFS transporter [Arthrobacter sp. StoSoilB22]|uniref:MFS transporter n=1 Tax=Arthrobacter sp. StoSoilB22 TaxID=2830996 RepID=UPI001CC341EB|nr:MFS transporter [Arthrobacter sp. StoSoilB22]BCW62915.1 MFS transporter [Arthrobacter sp. StoSoilB22]
MAPKLKQGQDEKQLPAQQSKGNFPFVGLVVLSAGIFTSMATEFLPAGLIPQLSGDFDRSVSEVGNLITVFALTVIVTAAPLAVLTRRIPRKGMVLGSFAAIGAANLLTVVAPTFEVLLVARVLGAVAHGAFWTVVAAYPAHLVRPSQLGKATAITAAGGSVSGVVGIPLGNALGQAFGWRVSFAALAVLVLIVLVLMIRFLPAIPGQLPARTSKEMVRDRQDKSLPAILMICLLILLVVAAQNGFGTFQVVWLLDVAHFATGAIPVVLLAGGIASAVGVAVVGALYSRFPRRLLLCALTFMVVILCTVPVAAASGAEAIVWILVILMGAVFGGIPVMLQTRMMWSASPHSRNLAAALQTTAFNVGIGGGAFFGGLALAGTSLALLPYWAAGGMFLALLTAGIWDSYGRVVARRLARNPNGAHGEPDAPAGR